MRKEKIIELAEDFNDNLLRHPSSSAELIKCLTDFACSVTDTLQSEKSELVEDQKISIHLLEKWINDLDSKNWHEEIVQEMKDSLDFKKQLLSKVK